MCGIAGSINSKLSMEDIDLIRHRGPDHQALKVIEIGSNSIYLGHTRLSILDLSTAGNQPMFSQCDNYCIIFNGEVYNHLELRKKLAGLEFKSHSDTETILYYIITFGIQAIQEFNGIFAFAFLDKKNAKLYLVRDHFGVKPLYYFFNGVALIFSSELKVIIANKCYEKQLNFSAINTLLTLRYNPAPDTVFKNICKLEAAHYIEYDIENKSLNVCKYWQKPQKINYQISKLDAIEEYRDLLQQSVKRQLLSDVPVGLFLSGGLDSAILGFLMSKYSNGQIKSFTIGFEGKGDFNELAYAKETAQLIHSDHHETLINKKEYLDLFYNSFYHIEEPIAEPTIPALLCVSSLASKHVKVVISGQGIDEPMAGYKRYKGEAFLNRFKLFLPLIPLNILKKVFPRSHTIARGAYATKFNDDLDRFIGIYTIYRNDIKEVLYQDKFQALKDEDQRPYFERYMNEADSTSDSLSKLLYIDTRTMLPDNLLLFNDKATMACSIENRVPYLDIDLINFIESLPVNYKLHGSTSKYLHREAVKGWISETIIYRKKRGFTTPIDKWFQQELSDTLLELVYDKDSFSRNYFDLSAVKKMINHHQKRKSNYKHELFIILSLELWFRYFYSKF